MKREKFRFESVDLLGMRFAALTADELLDRIFEQLEAAEGGWIVTANLDFLRRYVYNPTIRDLYREADIVVADGMPLVWASRIQGDRLPERIAGSTIIWSIVERAAVRGRSIYLLGGQEQSRIKAAKRFRSEFPSLKIAGQQGPIISDPPSNEQLAEICGYLKTCEPDIVLCGFGSPKQEYVIRAARAVIPHAWMIGVGISFSFVSGDVARAPIWMRKAGMEWLHRLAQEPSRLAKRYLIDDVPFAFTLFSVALVKRIRHRYLASFR